MTKGQFDFEKYINSNLDLDPNKILKEKGDIDSSPTRPTKSELRKMQPEARLDLHGMIGDQARAQVAGFMNDARRRHLTKVCIITGKGLHSKSDCVLKDVVSSYLKTLNFISYIETPPERHGGSGAMWVTLKRT